MKHIYIWIGGWSAYQIREIRHNWDKTLWTLKSLSIIRIKSYHCTTRLRVVMINFIVKSTWIINRQSFDQFESEKKFVLVSNKLPNYSSTINPIKLYMFQIYLISCSNYQRSKNCKLKFCPSISHGTNWVSYLYLLTSKITAPYNQLDNINFDKNACYSKTHCIYFICGSFE